MKTPENTADITVGSKTPEEIKKGLECCAGKCEGNVCNECPRSVYTLPELFTNEPAKDGLAYIQHLESRLAQAERERDAAVNELNESRCCWHCKHSRGSARKEPCRSCDLVLKNNYEWRGVCSENTKEDI